LHDFAGILIFFENGQVVLRGGLPVMNELIAEFEQIPYGSSDDLVDTAHTNVLLDAIKPHATDDLSTIRHGGTQQCAQGT
jgi:hypothetical protein